MNNLKLAKKIESKEMVKIGEIDSIPIYTYSEDCKDRERFDGGRIYFQPMRIVIDREVITNKDLYDSVIFHEYGHSKDTTIQPDLFNGYFYEEARFYYLKDKNEPELHAYEIFADWITYKKLGKDKAIKGLRELREYLDRSREGYEIRIREIDLRIKIMAENFEGYEYETENGNPEVTVNEMYIKIIKEIGGGNV